MVILGTVNNEHIIDKVFYQGYAPRKKDVRKAVAHAYTKNLNVQLINYCTGEILEWYNIIDIQSGTRQIMRGIQYNIYDIPLSWYL